MTKFTYGLLATSLLTLSISVSANATEESPIQRLKFNCEHKGDASKMLVEGKAQMDTSIQGTMVVDFSKESLPKEEGYKRFLTQIELRYRMKLNMTTPIDGNQTGLAAGEMKFADANLYQRAGNERVEIMVSRSEPKYASFLLSYQEKTGWLAHLTTEFDGSQTSEKLQDVMMRATVPCSMEDL